jgi:hypothetical protein
MLMVLNVTPIWGGCEERRKCGDITMHLSIARIREEWMGEGALPNTCFIVAVSAYKNSSFEQIKVETGSLIIGIPRASCHELNRMMNRPSGESQTAFPKPELGIRVLKLTCSFIYLFSLLKES